MDLNLRKARKLEVKIQLYLDTNALESTASVRTLGDAKEAAQAVEDTRVTSLKGLADRNQLLDVRYAIRRSIEQQNEESGINALLNDKILTERKIKELDAIDSKASFTEAELGDQLTAYAKILNSGSLESDRWGEKKADPKTTFKAPVFSKDDLEQFAVTKTDFQRRLEQIDDELSLKNLQSKVALSEDHLKLLESHRLL